jgi:hypothetical protein
MQLPLRDLAFDEVHGTKSYNARGILPKRMRRLAPEAHDSFVRDLADHVVVSDMFRSAEASLWAIENRKGAQPPGWSGHNYGWSIDLDLKATQKRLGLRSKRQLDEWMAARGWYCHRRDHRLRHESWHYNYLGPDGGGFLRESDRRTNSALQRLLTARYGAHWTLSVEALQGHLAGLAFYGGAIDGDWGPISRAACKAFQRAWGLAADGVPGKKTQRTLAYVTAERVSA